MNNLRWVWMVLVAGILLIGGWWMLRPSPTTPEQLTLRYLQAVMVQHDLATAQSLLCDEGYAYHQYNTREQIAFWSSPDVIMPPQNWQVGATQLISTDQIPPFYRVPLSFQYRYRFQGQVRDLRLDDTMIVRPDATRASGWCVAPWAGRR